MDRKIVNITANQYVINGNVTRTVATTNFSSAVPALSTSRAITKGTYAIVFDSDTPITFYLANNVGTQIMSVPFVNGSIGHNVALKSLNSAGTYINVIRYETSATETTTLSNFCLVNLTEMYGEGKEPSTAAQFLNDHPEFNSYVPNPGIKKEYTVLETCGQVDLGTLNWVYESGTPTNRWASNDLVSLLPTISEQEKPPFECTTYPVLAYNDRTGICITAGESKRIYVFGLDIEHGPSGILTYELATKKPFAIKNVITI